MSAKDTVLRRIAEAGPLPFEEFMSIALYDEVHGFFATGPLRSTKAGDFLTSPEVSPLFGATIARCVNAEWERLGRPDGFIIVEAGAGSGSLLAPLLTHLEFTPSAVFAVEASAAARRSLGERVPSATVVDSLAAVPTGFAGVVITNELLDNLPMAIGVREAGGWSERFVGAEGEALGLAAVRARSDVAAWLDAFAGPVPEGGVVEAQLAAREWVEVVLTHHLDAGALIVVDYGDTAEVLEPRRAEGTIRTYRAHHIGPHPLDEPGTTDITADVNFTAVLAAAEATGAAVSYQRQDEFLAEWGLRSRLSEVRKRELALAASGDAMARLAARSEVNEIETLLHPRGLGDFRVVVARR